MKDMVNGIVDRVSEATPHLSQMRFGRLRNDIFDLDKKCPIYNVRLFTPKPLNNEENTPTHGHNPVHSSRFSVADCHLFMSQNLK